MASTRRNAWHLQVGSASLYFGSLAYLCALQDCSTCQAQIRVSLHEFASPLNLCRSCCCSDIPPVEEISDAADNVLQHRWTQVAAAECAFQHAFNELASCKACLGMN